MTPLVAESFDLEIFEQFVLDEAHNLEKIEQYLNRFNLFEVLGITSQSLSNTPILLPGCLIQKESHGIGEYFLKVVYQTNFHYLSKSDKLKYGLSNFEKTEVIRDYEGIDILILNEEIKFTICIKNFLDHSFIDVAEILAAKL